MGFLFLVVLLQTAVRSLQSQWALHVIIGKSSAKNTLDTQISRIHNHISNYPSNRRSDRSMSSYWQQRLNFLRPIARLTVSSEGNCYIKFSAWQPRNRLRPVVI